MTPRTVVFAKAPVPGQVKTRLISALGADGAAALAQRMLAHSLAQATAAHLGPVELCVSPDPKSATWQPWRSVHPGAWSAQGEGDLGQRMARAAQRVLAAGESLLLIGTDCPSLTAPTLREAARALHQHDACLIPALDGGYVLLGLRRFDESIFEGIAWSTSGVLSATQARMHRLGWSVHTLLALPDIDEPADLLALPDGWLPPPS